MQICLLCHNALPSHWSSMQDKTQYRYRLNDMILSTHYSDPITPTCKYTVHGQNRSPRTFTQSWLGLLSTYGTGLYKHRRQ